MIGGNGWCGWPATGGGGGLDTPKTRWIDCTDFVNQLDTAANVRKRTGWNNYNNYLRYMKVTPSLGVSVAYYAMPNNWDGNEIYLQIYWGIRPGYTIDSVNPVKWQVSGQGFADGDQILLAQVWRDTWDTPQAPNADVKVYHAPEATFTPEPGSGMQGGSFLPIFVQRITDSNTSYETGIFGVRLRYGIA